MSLRSLKRLSATLILLLTAGVALSMPAKATETVFLSELDISKTRQDWGQPQADKSVDGKPLTIGGQKFEKGMGTHAISNLYIDLKDGGERFTASVGIDDEVNKAQVSSVVFRVLGDGKELWNSGLMRAAQTPKKVDVPLKGVKVLLLTVDSANNGVSFDHADWADAKIEYSGQRPETCFSHPEKGILLTPPPPLAPRINGAKVFGVKPGTPFIFTIPATGRRPIKFSAANLPEGLKLDSQTGGISGSIQKRGEYIVILSARNNFGLDRSEFKIVCGNTIALTPPMGWSSWNCFGETVDDAKVRAAAEALVKSGLIDHGWTYVNIDDGWQVQPGSYDPMLQGDPRDEQGATKPNKKFPDMQALYNFIHGKGLKTGISHPRNRMSDATLKDARRQQEIDIQRFGQWGIDFYKINWSSYTNINKEKGLPGMQEVYGAITSAIAKTRRDIVLSTTGAGLFREMGEDIGGNCWLTGVDITDNWLSMSRIGFALASRDQFTRPGRWNDADMLVVGMVGWGKLRPTGLTSNEQYMHVSLWCLLASPLMLGCDLTQLDEFTLNLLTNDEVLAVNQDPLGKQARRVSLEKDVQIWKKEMENGIPAVGLFNCGEMENQITVKWSDLNITGKQVVRDLWRQKDLGEFDEQFTTTVARHGVTLIRLRPSGK